MLTLCVLLGWYCLWMDLVYKMIFSCRFWTSKQLEVCGRSTHWHGKKTVCFWCLWLCFDWLICLIGSLSSMCCSYWAQSASNIFSVCKSQSGRRPQRGDLIEIFRGSYRHWAVYVGDGSVVHLVVPSKSRTHLSQHLPQLNSSQSGSRSLNDITHETDS